MTIEQCGKVIEYDFAPRMKLQLSVEGDIIYCDDNIMLAKYVFIANGKPHGSYHFMTDLHTGKIAHL